MLSGLLNGLSLIDDQEEGAISFMFSDGNYSLIHLSLNVQGNTKDIIWNYNKNNWKVVWKALQSEYDVYGKCGVGHLVAAIHRVRQFAAVYWGLSQITQKNGIEEIGLVDV